jgi:hypothetical protein
VADVDPVPKLNVLWMEDQDPRLDHYAFAEPRQLRKLKLA